MEVLELGSLAALGLGAGLLIGCVGIGGVILVPALVYVAGVPVQTAIAAAMCAFLLSGVAGTWVFAAHKSIRWGMTVWMWTGAVPAAFAGALFVNVVAPWILELAIGLLSAASGAYALAGRPSSAATGARALSRPALASIGIFTGFTSALTGTGGPLVLIPILVWLELPVLVAIGLAQAIQLPIAIAATAGNVLSGTLDVVPALVIGLGVVAGTWAGAKAAHQLPRVMLQSIVSVLLVVVGAAILGRLLFVGLAGP